VLNLSISSSIFFNDPTSFKIETRRSHNNSLQIENANIHKTLRTKTLNQKLRSAIWTRENKTSTTASVKTLVVGSICRIYLGFADFRNHEFQMYEFRVEFEIAIRVLTCRCIRFVERRRRMSFWRSIVILILRLWTKISDRRKRRRTENEEWMSAMMVSR
jgi:hypothetical protein